MCIRDRRYKGDTRTIAQVVEKVVKEAMNEFTTKGKKKINLIKQKSCL